MNQAKNIVVPYKRMKGSYLCSEQVRICFEISNSYTHLYDQKKKKNNQNPEYRDLDTSDKKS